MAGHSEVLLRPKTTEEVSYILRSEFHHVEFTAVFSNKIITSNHSLFFTGIVMSVIWQCVHREGTRVWWEEVSLCLMRSSSPLPL